MNPETGVTLHICLPECSLGLVLNGNSMFWKDNEGHAKDKPQCA